MADKFAFKKGFDSKRGQNDGYPAGFDHDSTAALRRARYKGIGSDRVIVHNATDYDHLHNQGHLDRHPDSPQHHGMELEDEHGGEPKYEVKLTPHARHVMNQMKS